MRDGDEWITEVDEGKEVGGTRGSRGGERDGGGWGVGGGLSAGRGLEL